MNNNTALIRIEQNDKWRMIITYNVKYVCGPTQPPVQWVPGVLSPGVKHS
jgi:hypothetical protein